MSSKPSGPLPILAFDDRCMCCATLVSKYEAQQLVYVPEREHWRRKHQICFAKNLEERDR